MLNETHIMFHSALLTIACLTNGVLSISLFSQCKLTDNACIEKISNAAIPMLMSENSEIGSGSSDPLSVDKIEGKLSILKYNLYNSTHTGFKSCVVSNLKINEDITNVHCQLTCTKISMKGSYDISGRLVILPVEGSGDYKLSSGKYLIDLDLELKKNSGKDGKTYLAIKNFKQKSTALEPMYFEFQNLFNGQKDLSDAVHKFAHDNWKEVADLVQDPILYVCLKKMFGNVNKYLKHVALEDVLLK